VRIGLESKWIPHKNNFYSKPEYYVHWRITQREFETTFKSQNLTTENTEGTEEDTESPLESSSLGILYRNPHAFF
jgi:hypothetical protein